MKFKKILFLCGLLSSLGLKAQEVGIDQWRSHLPYNDALAVAEAGNRIYCATGSGLFYYNKEDNSLNTVTKISGLSDIEVSAMRYNPATKTLIISYTNSNIDVIGADDQVYNVADIKRKAIVGDKAIYSISCKGNLAYLGCGFGIVVMDIAKREIKDTYYIGANAGALRVNEVAVSDSFIYAATQTGLYKVSLDSSLEDYHNWFLLKGIPKGVYNTVTYLDGSLYAGYSYQQSKNTRDKDTVYVFNKGQRSIYQALLGTTVKKLDGNYGKLIVTLDNSGLAIDAAGNKTVLNGYYAFINPRQFILDKDNTYWAADNLVGLAKLNFTTNYEVFAPNGPFRKLVYNIASRGNNVIALSGGVKQTFENLLIVDGIYSFRDNVWKNYNGFTTAGMDGTVFDPLAADIDPQDAGHFFVALWGRGLVEFKDDKIINKYNETNSSLRPIADPNFYALRIGGLIFDSNNNLWVSNSNVNNPLSVRKPDGTWKSFFLSDAAKDKEYTQVIVDGENQKWILNPRSITQGLGVLNDNNTIDDTGDDRFRFITFKLNTGYGPKDAQPSCIAPDRDGAIWVGTDYGIVVLYSPAEAFTDNFSPQQIAIRQDGNVQYLLESELVTTIAVDGANRKWVGTSKAGVFLFSPDGTKQLFHFTQENSPLLSNEIKSVAINNVTGEVFFGTSQGIVSFKSSATGSAEDFGNVYAYPNPVPPDYTGKIGIRGLVDNVNVKVTDVSGKLVYETTAQGGQAIWDGRTLSGEKVRTGVYLVFFTNSDGLKTFVTKLVFIN